MEAYTKRHTFVNSTTFRHSQRIAQLGQNLRFQGPKIHALENKYLNYASTQNLNLKSHITRFPQELLCRAPHHEVLKLKNGETRVFAKTVINVKCLCL